MTHSSAPKIVLLGMMSKMPVPGVIWQNLHYLLGFRALGYDPYYVEAHGRTPSMLMGQPDDDSSQSAANLIGAIMSRFGFETKWAFHAVHSDGRCFGMDQQALRRLYRSSALLINLHGGTKPLDEHAATGRLVYLETDPVQLQMELHQGLKQTIDSLERHVAFFTFAENYGTKESLLPVSERFVFRPTRQPVTMSEWGASAPSNNSYTTVANWRQRWRPVRFEGRVYHWSKNLEFDKVLELPSRTGLSFELAVSGHTAADASKLRRSGWRLREALAFGTDLDEYRTFIQQSRGEFTVAKEQNVRFRTGWFSDRSATYLAAGRPVVTQDTGFGTVLPVGEGLFAFSSSEDAEEALQRVEKDHERHATAARNIAHAYFSDRVVLGRLLEDVGLPVPGRPAANHSRPLPRNLMLEPVSRKPLRLADSTVKQMERRPIPLRPLPMQPRTPRRSSPTQFKKASIVVVTRNNLLFTRMCLEGLLTTPAGLNQEIIVVDNGSTDGTIPYLRDLAGRFRRIRTLFNEQNAGFAAGVNRGLDGSHGDVLVLMNNDTIVTPRWLSRLCMHLQDPAVGLVGPVTNRCGNEAEIETSYATYGELLQFAAERPSHSGSNFDIRTLTMFCTAMRRDVHEALGPLDEQFEVGLFEDDDYSMRVRQAGYRVVCAEDAFVHHFGQASFGQLVPSGTYARLFEGNRARFEEKWGVEWRPHEMRRDDRYRQIVARVRDEVSKQLPVGSTVAIVSKGDDEMLKLERQIAWHFPQGRDGTYAGFYPGHGLEAVAALEAVRAKGAQYVVFPPQSYWWLEHYGELREHLRRRYRRLPGRQETCVIFALGGPGDT